MPLTFADPASGLQPWDAAMNANLDAIKTWAGNPDDANSLKLARDALASISAEAAVGPSSGAETTIIQATYPGGIATAGTTLRFKFFATHQSQATSGALTFKLYYGVNSISLAWPTTAGAIAQTSAQFEGLITVRAAGAAGTFIANSIYTVQTGVTAVNWFGSQQTTTVAVDTTQAQTVKLTAQWATSSATNILKVENATIELVKF